jgi:hypothetical protein
MDTVTNLWFGGHSSIGVFDPVQTPPWQTSFMVQALPSLHGAVLLT